MGKILRIGYRQLDAIRTQVAACLAGQCAYSLNFSLREWLEDPHKIFHDKELTHTQSEIPRYALEINVAMDNALACAYKADPDWADYRRENIRSTTCSTHEEEDHHGTNHAGGWDGEQFILRGGIVFTLGALEDFERGIIRLCLLRQTYDTTESESPWEPDLQDFLSESPASCLLKEVLYQRNRRRKLLKQFGITFSGTLPWVSRLDSAYKARNVYAHGGELSPITISDFLSVHYATFCCMKYIATTCQESLGIVI